MATRLRSFPQPFRTQSATQARQSRSTPEAHDFAPTEPEKPRDTKRPHSPSLQQIMQKSGRGKARGRTLSCDLARMWIRAAQAGPSPANSWCCGHRSMDGFFAFVLLTKAEISNEEIAELGGRIQTRAPPLKPRGHASIP